MANHALQSMELPAIRGEDVWGAPPDPATFAAQSIAQEMEVPLITGADVWGEPDDYGVPKGEASKTVYLMNAAKKTLADLISLPGLAVDVMGMAYNSLSDLTNGALPPVDNFAGGSKNIQDNLYDLSGVEDLEAPDKETEQMGTFIKYALPAIVTGPTMVALQMGSKIKTLDAAGVAAPQLMSSAAKVKTLFTELAFGAGSGLGAVLGREVAEDTQSDMEWGELWGSLAGIFTSAGLTGLVNKAQSGSQGGASLAEKEMSGLSKAEKRLQKEMDKFKDSPKNMAKARALSDNIPGYRGDLAQNAQNPGLRSIVEGFGMNDGDFYAKFMDLNKADAEAIATRLNTFLPRTLRDEVSLPKSTYRKLGKKLDEGLAKTEKELDRLSAIFARQPSAEIGSELRKLRAVQMEKAQGIKDLKYDELYAEAQSVGLEENMGPIYRKTTELIDEAMFQSDDLPLVFKQILRDFEPQQSPVVLSNGASLPPQDVWTSFEEFHSLDKRLSKDWKASEGLPVRQQFIGELQKFIKARIATYEDSVRYGEVADKLKIANAANARYKNTFSEGVGGAMDKSTRIQDVVADEDIVRKIVLGRVGGVAQFRQIYGESKAANKLLLNGILDIFQKTAKDGKTKQITTAGIRKFIKNNEEVLDDLPAIRKMLESTTARTKALETRRIDLKARQKVVDQSRLQKMRNTNDTDGLLQRALKNKKEMNSLLKESRTIKGGEQSLVRSVVDKLMESKDPLAMVDKYKNTLAPVFKTLSPKHLQNLLDIFEAVTRNKAASIEGRLSGKKPALDTIKETIGTSPTGIGTRIREVSTQRGSPEFAMSDVGGRLLFKIKQDSFEQLMKEALLQPQLGSDLKRFLQKSTFTQGDVTTLKQHLTTFGLLAAARYDEDAM